MQKPKFLILLFVELEALEVAKLVTTVQVEQKIILKSLPYDVAVAKTYIMITIVGNKYATILRNSGQAVGAGREVVKRRRGLKHSSIVRAYCHLTQDYVLFKNWIAAVLRKMDVVSTSNLYGVLQAVK